MAGTVEILVPGGKASPGPPLGPEFDPTPVDVRDAVSDISDQTVVSDGTEAPVTIEYDDDGSLSIEVGVPPTTTPIKDKVGFDTDSDEPQENSVADMSIEQLKKAAEQKSSNLPSYGLKNASKEVVGICASLGITIEGEDVCAFKQRIDGSDFNDYPDDE